MKDVNSTFFQKIDVGATTFKQFSPSSLKGEIVAIDVKANCVGSIWFGESGSDHPIALLSLTSGATATFERVYPVVAVETNAGAALSGTSLTAYRKPYCNGELIASGLGLASGTSHDIDFIEVHWR